MKQVKLTQSVIAKAEPPSFDHDGKPRQEFIRDSSTPGFGVRITSRGVKSFIVEERINGRVKRHTLGKVGCIQLNDARVMAMNFITQIANNEDPLAANRAQSVMSTTVGQAFEDYLLVRNNLKASTVKDYRRTIHGALADWADLPLVAITRDMVEKRHRELGQKSHARANNSMRVLRAVFNHAKGKYEDENGNPVFTHNPVDRISFNRGWYKIQPRRGYIKPYQIAGGFMVLNCFGWILRVITCTFSYSLACVVRKGHGWFGRMWISMTEPLQFRRRRMVGLIRYRCHLFYWNCLSGAGLIRIGNTAIMFFPVIQRRGV